MLGTGLAKERPERVVVEVILGVFVNLGCNSPRPLAKPLYISIYKGFGLAGLGGGKQFDDVQLLCWN